MSLQFKHIQLSEFEVKFADNGEAVIEGYASTFGNVDNQNDVVVAGAFKSSIARQMPVMLYQHQQDRIPGIWESAAEDSKGLIVKGRTLNTTLGRDTAEEVRSGALKTMSIGYGTKKARFDKANSIRYLEQLDLWEVSLVTFPANDKAVITAVKAAHETERDFEDFLREAGYSREAAKIITAKGFKALPNQREAEAQEHETLITLFNQFKP